MEDLSTLVVIVFTILLTVGAMSFAIVYGVKESNAIRRYQDYIRFLKAEGKYEVWQKENYELLLAVKISRYGALVGVVLCILQVLFNSGNTSLWLVLLTLICFLATSMLTRLLRKKVPAETK
jgi:hypothetical protein